MKFSAFLLVAVVTSASPNLQSAPKVINPTQHNSEGSRVWAGTSVGFLTLVSAIPSSNLPNVARSGTPEDPQVVETEDGAVWWGFKALPPIADYSKAIFATSTDHRIWVSFKDNATHTGENAALRSPIVEDIDNNMEHSSGSNFATLAMEKHPLGVDDTDSPAIADLPSNISARSDIWWGYPEGDFGKSPRLAAKVEERETSTSTSASPHIEKRIWWGYPEGDFGKSRKNLEPSAAADAAANKTEATEVIAESANNIYWALPPKDARNVPEKAVVGHDAKGRVWWGYPVDASKATEQNGDGGVAIDRDGTQFRIYWGYPDSKENNIRNETAAKSLAEAVTQDQRNAKGEKGVLISAAPSTKQTSSIFGAIKDLFPLGHGSTEVALSAGVSEGGKDGDHESSAVKKGELERKQRAEAMIRMVETQTDEVLREELAQLAEHLLDDLKEYRLNAAASENAKGGKTSKTPLTALVSLSDAAAVATSAVGSEIEAGDLSKEEMNRRFEELKSKYEKLLNVVGKSA